MAARLMALVAAIWLAVLGATGVGVPSASGEEDAVEVRVAARRLADEAAHGVRRNRDGSSDAVQDCNREWERAPPRCRRGRALLPRDGTRFGQLAGELAAATVSAPAAAARREVRVAAGLLVDGRMEFALQERGPDGEWGERQLPRARLRQPRPDVGVRLVGIRPCRPRRALRGDGWPTGREHELAERQAAR